MAAVRWMKISTFLMLLLQFTAATAAGAQQAFITISAGDEVALPCGNRTDQRDDSPEWLFVGFGSSVTETLFRMPDIKVNRRSDRLSVTADISLVMKAVTAEDVGFYTCRRNISGQREDVDFFLSVVVMAKQVSHDRVVLNCSVLQYEEDRHRVAWLSGRKGEMVSDTQISPSSCSATVTFQTSESQQTFNESLSCQVTNTYTKQVWHFPFLSPSSGAMKKSPPEQQDLANFLRGILVSAGLAILIVSVITVNIWIKIKGSESKMNEDARSNNAEEDKNIDIYETINEVSASNSLH